MWVDRPYYSLLPTHLLRGGLVVLIGLDLFYLGQGVEAADDAAEDSVLTIEVRGTLEGDNVSK